MRGRLIKSRRLINTPYWLAAEQLTRRSSEGGCLPSLPAESPMAPVRRAPLAWGVPTSFCMSARSAIIQISRRYVLCHARYNRTYHKPKPCVYSLRHRKRCTTLDYHGQSKYRCIPLPRNGEPWVVWALF